MLPLRTSFTQYGATTARPSVFVVTPSAARRRWNVRPLPGVMAMNAFLEPSVRFSRIMTPALAQGSVFSWLATFAMIVPSPLRTR